MSDCKTKGCYKSGLYKIDGEWYCDSCYGAARREKRKKELKEIGIEYDGDGE